jgi:hypothetical protein
MALYSAWLAYRRDLIGLLDLRVWLASFELLATRCKLKKGLRPKYCLKELQSLLGGQSDRRLRAALRRLQNAGLLTWTEEGIEIVRTAGEAGMLGFTDACLLPDGFLCRPAPVPPGLAHVIRGAFLRGGKFVNGGRCKASWVADVFGVDTRNVKYARKQLLSDGWMKLIAGSQTGMNRWGAAFQFDFERRLNPTCGASKVPPVQCRGGTKAPPPYNNKNLLIGCVRTMKPAKGGPDGAYAESQKPGEATMRRVTLEDLKSRIRNEGLFRDAVRSGLVAGTTAARLNVFAAIEHAKAYGTKNPCGLFVWIVRNQRWNHVNQRDEDRARVSIGWLRDCWKVPGEGRQEQPKRSNGSATDAAREGVPVAARQILAGTDAGKYPLLAQLSQCLRGLSG